MLLRRVGAPRSVWKLLGSLLGLAVGKDPHLHGVKSRLESSDLANLCHGVKGRSESPDLCVDCCCL